MAKLLLFNKPCQVMCQFSDSDGRKTLADYIDVPGVYPAGRLDYDSEGLVLLCDDGRLQARIAHPRHKMRKYYLVQLEGEISESALGELEQGVMLKDGHAAALTAVRITEPALWPRVPPIRQRKHLTTSWIELCIDEGRNRQVRRMTAAVGFPTLRLVRWRIGEWTLENLASGEFRTTTVHIPGKRSNRRPG